MKKFLVEVREVHVQPVLIEAESIEEAMDKVDTSSENYCDYPLEYSHMMDKQFWTAEEVQDDGVEYSHLIDKQLCISEEILNEGRD